MSDLEDFKHHFENNPIANREKHHAEAKRIEDLLMIVLKNQDKATQAMKLSAALCLVTSLAKEASDLEKSPEERRGVMLNVAETINKLSVHILKMAVKENPNGK